jgi:hypothetical protein
MKLLAWSAVVLVTAIAARDLHSQEMPARSAWTPRHRLPIRPLPRPCLPICLRASRWANMPRVGLE